MSRPRQVLPGSFFMINRRCTQRQLLLRPDQETNNAILYCLGCAMKKYEIEVVMMAVASNHHHTIIYDRHGNMPLFMEYFHKLVARSQNALRRRAENLWAAEEPCVVHLLKPADVLDKVIYAASNPVKDRLVDRVMHWPGINGYTALLSGRPFKATRPRHFFRVNGGMPASVEFELTVPAELGARQQVIAYVRAGVERVEHDLAIAIRTQGVRVLGRRQISEQSWNGFPTSDEARGTLRPRFATKDAQALEAARRSFHAFLEAYRKARAAWVQRLDAVFPPGTYWLRRFAGVPVAGD